MFGRLILLHPCSTDHDIIQDLVGELHTHLGAKESKKQKGTVGHGSMVARSIILSQIQGSDGQIGAGPWETRAGRLGRSVLAYDSPARFALPPEIIKAFDKDRAGSLFASRTWLKNGSFSTQNGPLHGTTVREIVKFHECCCFC